MTPPKVGLLTTSKHGGTTLLVAGGENKRKR